MSIRDYATENVIKIRQGASIMDAARLMRDENVGTVIVTDDNEQPTGILTDRDIVLKAVAQNGTRNTDSSVDEIMTTDPRSISQTAGLEEALEMMCGNQVRRLIVMDERGLLSGVLSFDGLLSVMGRKLAKMAEVVENQYDDQDHVNATDRSNGDQSSTNDQNRKDKKSLSTATNNTPGVVDDDAIGGSTDQEIPNPDTQFTG